MILCNFNGHCFPSKDLGILSGCWRCSGCDQGLDYNGSYEVHVEKWNRTQNKIKVVFAGNNFQNTVSTVLVILERFTYVLRICKEKQQNITVMHYVLMVGKCVY